MKRKLILLEKVSCAGHAKIHLSAKVKEQDIVICKFLHIPYLRKNKY